MKAETPPIKVRRASDEDAELLLLFAEAQSIDERSPAPFLLEEATLAAWLSAGLYGWIAEINGAPCGMATAYPGFDSESNSVGFHLSDLYVAPNMRLQGVARALLAAIAAEALGQGRIWLSWTVLKNNRPAKAFYRALAAVDVPVDFMALGRQGLERLAQKRSVVDPPS